MSPLTLIVAATRSGGIGQAGTLPWRLPKEMAYFTRVTSGAPEGKMNALIMGRNTWESIPPKFRPLKKRVNIIISRNVQYQLEPRGEGMVYLHTDMDSALARLRNPAFTETPPIYRGFIIGGASLYCDTLAIRPSTPSSTATVSDYVDRILLTRIISPVFEQCDVFMPDFLRETMVLEGGERLEWKRAEHGELEKWVGFEVPKGVQEENGIQYEFQMWIRGC